MKAITLITAFALVFSAPLALANGGGYAKGSKCASLMPFEMQGVEAIAMETEDLRVEVGPSHSLILVRYTMRNTTGKEVKCRFGFPMDTGRMDMDKWSASGNYEVKKNGTTLPFVCQKEKESGLSFERETIAYWMVSELTAAPNEEFTLEITLKAPHFRSGLSISEDWYEDEQFVYRFSSAAVWNGPIRKGHVEIIPKGIEPGDLRPVKPANRFTRREDDGAWVWDFTDLEPTLDDDVAFQIGERVEGHAAPLVKEDEGDSLQEVWNRSDTYVLRHGDRWVRGIGITAWTMSASHTSARKIEHYYREEKIEAPLDVAQLPYRHRYSKHDDVWGTDAPNNGIGQSVTMAFGTPTQVGLLSLLDFWPIHEGYGRVKALKVVVNGKWSKEFTLKEHNRTYLPLFDAPKAKTIQLIITDAEKGDKHPEVILSNLRAYRTQPKKPNFTHCR